MTVIAQLGPNMSVTGGLNIIIMISLANLELPPIMALRKLANVT